MTSDLRIGWYVKNLVDGDISLESVNQDLIEMTYLTEDGHVDCSEDIAELTEAVSIFKGF